MKTQSAFSLSFRICLKSFITKKLLGSNNDFDYYLVIGIKWENTYDVICTNNVCSPAQTCTIDNGNIECKHDAE